MFFTEEEMEMKMKSTADYQAFLLRLWREDDLSGWRASLENPHTGKSVGFPSMQHLFAYIEKQIEEKGIEDRT